MSFGQVTMNKCISLPDYMLIHDKAVDLVRTFLEDKLPDKIVERGDKCDLLLSGHQKINVEVKPTWDSYDFPFEAVHLSKKYETMINDGWWFCVVNAPLTRMFVVKGKDIQNAPTNAYNYVVPISKGEFYNL